MSSTNYEAVGAVDTEKIIAVDGSRVRIATHERPYDDRRPLLMINGIGSRLEMWQPFNAALAGRRLFNFDMPGITGIPSVSFPMDLKGMAQWLTRLLDTVGIDEVDLLGYSWGGLLAQQFARNTPNRARALILAATNFGFGELPTFDILPFLNVLPSASGDDPWKLVNAAVGGTPGARISIGAILQTANPAHVEGYLRQIVALTGWSSLQWLQQLQMPALVIAGDDDPYVSRSISRRLAQSIPNAKLKVVAGGGHLLPMNQPAQMARIVDGFLSWVDRDGDPARLKYELGSYAVK